MRDNFSTYHPLVIFVYFASVIIFSMFFMHPGLLLVSAVCAFSYCVYLGGAKAAALNLNIIFFMGLTAVAVNMLFNHRGMTTLFYFRGNPVTLESAVYGASAGLMLAVMIMWFSCCHKAMTSDKIMYLFGRIMPVFSLIFSMTLRFVPRFAEKAKEISEAQRGMGICGNTSEKKKKQGLLLKIKNGLRTSSVLTTWALENAVDTADSMRSRGYGLPGRTAFSLYRIDRRDCSMAAIIAALDIAVGICALHGESAFCCFPMIKTPEFTIYTAVILAAYLLLGVLPLITNLREDIKWRYLQSKI